MFPLVAFPSLEELRLDPEGLPWLHLLAVCGDGGTDLAPTAAVMKTNAKETLKLLHCPKNTPVDRTLLSSILSFHNLVALRVKNDCCKIKGTCTFSLTDGDVENLAIALPSLTEVEFGKGCRLNSCRTTVASLLSISTNWLGLKLLEIHFNTRTIAKDMRRLLDGGFGCDKPRCGLERLWVGHLPLRARKEIGAVAMGFADIFPCLKDFASWDGRCSPGWWRVASELRARD